MTTRHIAGLCAILLSIAAPLAASAQSAPAPVAAAPAPKKAASDPRVDPNTIVCKAEDVTGSRLGAKKVCLTRQQWADMAQDSHDRLQQSQNLTRTH
jgi:hypothetical protein